MTRKLLYAIGATLGFFGEALALRTADGVLFGLFVAGLCAFGIIAIYYWAVIIDWWYTHLVIVRSFTIKPLCYDKSSDGWTCHEPLNHAWHHRYVRPGTKP